MTAAHDVWWVVLSWNGRADTLALLETLVPEPATVLVVDNGSSDGTAAAVRERYPDVVVVESGANLGYAGGNNLGVAHATRAGARFVGVLNNDTLVVPGLTRALLDELRQDAAPTAVSPDIRYADDPATSWYRGGRIDPATASPVHLAPVDQPATDRGAVATDVLTGCCILAGVEVWERVGPFDEGMYLIFEDSDWSMRARRCGVHLKVVPAASIAHRVSRSFTGDAARLATFYFARNGVVFAVRHLGPVAVPRFLWTRVLRPTARSAARERTVGGVVLALLGVAAGVSGRSGRAGPVVSAVARRVQPRLESQER